MTMITLSNGEKSIDISLTNEIIKVHDTNYKVNSPIISCSKEEDAMYIQSKINEFVHNLSRELLN